MSENSLVIINNEKVCEKGNEFYCDNYNFKILPEGLNNYYQVQYIVRSSNKQGGHKINLQNIKIASNIIQFVYFVISTFKNKRPAPGLSQKDREQSKEGITLHEPFN